MYKVADNSFKNHANLEQLWKNRSVKQSAALFVRACY